MDRIKVYKILANKFSGEEAELIMKYIESARQCSSLEKLNELRLMIEMKYQKLDTKIIVGLIIVAGISIIMVKALANAVLK